MRDWLRLLVKGCFWSARLGLLSGSIAPEHVSYLPFKGIALGFKRGQWSTAFRRLRKGGHFV